MQSEEDILDLLRRKTAESYRLSQRGLILQSGAIGDCILTLPLVEVMKDSLGLGGVDILGHIEYIDFMPGRTCVDGIRCMDSIDLHRLFANAKEFNPADGDPLIRFFADYNWIVTFLGEPDSDFEKNLIFTACCSRNTEVITLPLKPPKDCSEHISDFYRRQFLEQSGVSAEYKNLRRDEYIIRPRKADIDAGRELLNEQGIDADKHLVMIAPGSGSKDKCWCLENFLRLASKLREKGAEVLFVLGPAEMERFDDKTLDTIGDTAGYVSNLSLTDVMKMLSCTDAFVGNDSGITHLAAVMGVKTVAVFGPSDPVVYKPLGPAVTVFRDAGADFYTKPSHELRKEIFKTLTAGF